MLKDPSPLVQSMAAAGLGNSHYVDGVPALAKLATAARAAGGRARPL